jgi:hypothetical protein
MPPRWMMPTAHTASGLTHFSAGTSGSPIRLPSSVVTASRDHVQGKAEADIVEEPNVPTLTNGPPHISLRVHWLAIALISATACVEPTSYHKKKKARLSRYSN